MSSIEWMTEFIAMTVDTGNLDTYAGPIVHGNTKKEAQDWCTENAGHLRITGKADSKGDVDFDTMKIDKSSIVEYNNKKKK